MADPRVLRTKPGPQVGQIIDLFPPWPHEGGRWIVVAIHLDPDAVWNLTYDGDEPDAMPETVLLHLSPVK